MRMAEFHIDGFGRFQNLAVSDLGPGLSIVLGKNEAGKSTLLAFLRSVLFGLPSRKQADFYPPLNGGNHGGRVVLVHGSEQIIVERFRGPGSGRFTATFADGSQLGEEPFRERLGMVSADVYEKVFAFGLGELQTFDTLKDDKIRDAIYNAGMGTGGISPASVVKSLTDRYERLFKPRGANPEINQVLRRLLHRQQQIDEHATDQEEYRRIQDELRRADRKTNEIGFELQRGRQRLARLHTLQQARNDWILLNDVRDRLRTLPQIESFPPDGVSRMNTLLNEQRSARNQQREARDELREAGQEVSAIQVDETLLSLSSEIRGLERRLDVFEQNRRELTAVAAERRLAEQQLAGNLLDLGDEWTEEKLRRFDLSIPAKEAFDSIRRACEEAHEQVEKQAAVVDVHHRQLQEKREIERVEREKQEQLAGPAAELDADGIRHLQRHQAGYEGARRNLPRVEQECRGNEGRLREMLRSIGPDWNEERLDRFDNSLAARETVSAHRDTLSHLRFRRDQSQTRTENTRASVQEHQAAVERDEAVLSSMPESDGADETALMEQKGKLRGLRSLLTRHSGLRADLAHQEERQQDLEEQLSRLQHDVEGPAGGIPRWWVMTAALVGTMLGVLVLLVTGILRQEWVTGTVGLVICLVPAVVLLVVRRKAVSAAHAWENQRLRDKRILTQRLADVELKNRECHERESQWETEIRQSSESAGFDGLANIRHVEEREELLERQLSLLRRRRPVEQRLEDNRGKLERAQAAFEDAEGTRGDLELQWQRAESAWRTWLPEAGLPETLSPELAVEVLSRLESARELLRAIDDQRNRIRAMREEIGRFEESTRSAATNSGIDDLPEDTLAAVPCLADRLEKHEQRLRSLSEARRRVDEAAEGTVRARKSHEESQRLHDADLAQQKRVNQQWIELLRRRGLRDTLSVDHAEQMIQGINRVRGQLDQLDNHKAKEKALAEQTAAFVSEVGAVAQQARLASPSDAEISTCVETFASHLKQAEEAQHRREIRRETIQKSADRIQRLESEIDERQQGIDHLLAAAGTSDEESFRQRASDYNTFQSCTEQARSLETRLRQLAGSADALASLEQELAQSPAESLLTEQQAVDEDVKRFEDVLGETKELQGKLKLQLQQLENSDELSSLRIQQQADLAEFRDGAEEWAVLKITAHLIDRAREKYERERRPAVLKQAERYFARLTHETYREIRAPVGAEPSVVAADGSRKELRQLSRGTAEQLYLSLRFGFIEEFVERSERLPLIFDDILVNFDPDRASAAAEAIVEFSRSQQILLFTCHPTTAQQLKTIDARARIYVLQDGILTNDNGDCAD